ncbi:MAG: hypothetical protein ACXVEE_30340 [Polyangiales bacterium]
MRALCLVGLLAIASCGRGRAAPPVQGCQAALLSFTEHEVSADGVVRDARWQERFVRCGEETWRERVLPEHRVKAPAPHDEHDHPDLALVAKHYVKGKVELVDRGRKMVIEVDKPEFESIGFDGSFDGAARLVRSDVRQAMQKIDRRAPEGAVWLERKNGTRFQRVLWSSQLDLALAIETGSEDGTQTTTLTVTLENAPPTLPWDALAGFTRKEWADLGD